TVYIRERSREGELHGVMIYDGREKEGAPSTILAKRGALVAGPQGFDVVVYDGSRQEFDSETGKLQRLNFERYTVELPDADPERENYRQPDERTFFELFFPDMENQRDVGNLREFR